MSDNNSIYLVDGSSLAFRSFFALITSGLRRGDGLPTWAVIGFFNSLFELIEKRNPHCLAISFDLAEPTFRHEEFSEYKANRADMPDDLALQWPIIKEGVKLLGIPLYEVAGYEADDVIGTVAKVAEHKGMKVVILTGDQDTFQLLDENIQVLMPSKEGLLTYGRQEVFNKLGVWPEQVIDYKGLVGDSSDNIPGVRGIGPKTAVQLLTEYKTVEGVYENLENVKSASVKKKLEEGRQSAFASKNLATIRLDVPVLFDTEQCRLNLPPVEEVANFFREVESSSILRRLPRILRAFNNGVEPHIDPALLEPIGKASRGSKMSFRKGSGAVATAEPDAPPATASGAVAVAEQQRIDLVIGTKSIKVGPVGLPEPQVIRTPDQLRELTTALAKQQIVALEVLTDTHESCEGCVVGYAFAYDNSARMGENQRPEIDLKQNSITTAYVPVRHQGDGEQLDPTLVQSALKPIFEDKSIAKISYNSKHELNALALAGIDYGPIAFDPMLASYVMNPDQSHKLKDQAQRILGYNLPNAADLIGTGKKQLTWDHMPVLSASRYAVDAARIAFLLCGWYVQQMDPEQQELLWEMDLPLCTVLATLEQSGVKIDVPYFENFANELNGELSRLESEIFELAGHSFNINSPLQLQKVLFQELNLPTKGKTKSGYSTDASVLEALSSEHAIVRKILEYRQLSKLNSTYVESLPRQISSRDGRVHGEFNQTTTATGRLSSTNPNLQNIPIRSEIGHRIRKGFIPSDDQHVIMSADYSQIELRLLAHMSGDEKLIEAFRLDQDIHTRTAMDIFDLTPETVNSDHRRVGKTLNFALIYQQGAFATAQSLGVSTKEAQEFINKYFATYPKVRSFMSGVISEARRQSYVQTLWGRRRYFANLNDRNDPVRKADERAACNAPLQGSASDLIKLAMIRLHKELASRNLQAKLILQVHDELVLNVPKAQLEETKEVVRESMQMDQPLLVPLRVDIGVGPNWMDAK